MKSQKAAPALAQTNVGTMPMYSTYPHTTANATPGPWRVLEPYTDRAVFPIGYDRGDGATNILAEVNSQGGTPEQCVANAALIASAPDLLAERDSLRSELAAVNESLEFSIQSYHREKEERRAAQRDREPNLVVRSRTLLRENEDLRVERDTLRAEVERLRAACRVGLAYTVALSGRAALKGEYIIMAEAEVHAQGIRAALAERSEP